MCFVAGIMLGCLVPLFLNGLVVISTETENQSVYGDEETLLVLYRKPAENGAEDGKSPVAVIYCTHATEEYAGETRKNGVPGGVMEVAAELGAELERYGVTVILDQQLHDSPDYNEAYASSLASVTGIKAEYPEAEVFIDVHRDSMVEGVDTTLETEEGDYARLMFVVGTDEKYEHPEWETNYAFVREVQAALEAATPGITRETRIYSGRYNQHVAENAILVEFGSNGNERAEAVASARLLAEAIAAVKGWEEIMK